MAVDAQSGIVTSHLSYAFPTAQPCITDFSIDLPLGSRCLLIGCNGAGKSTLLKLLAGKFMVPEDMIRVLGYPPFHDLVRIMRLALTSPASSRCCWRFVSREKLSSGGDLAFLGHQWRRSVACAGGDLPMQGDISAGALIMNVADVDENRRSTLVQLLDINLTWRMHQVSDGQRRRVQMCMGLLKPFKVLLLDEVTVDMDVLGRLQLLRFLKHESEVRNCVILYATHIFDGMSDWATHLLMVSDGKPVRAGPVSQFPELAEGKVLHTVVRWLREEKAKAAQTETRKAPRTDKTLAFGARHMAFYR